MKKFQIILILLVIILAVLIYFSVWPKYQNYKNLTLLLQAKKAALDQKQGYFSKLTNISVKMEKYQEELDKIDSALPDEISEPAILNFIEEKSFESGLIINQLSVQEGASQVGGGGVKKISFSTEVMGSYLSFKRFLSELYQNSKLIDVDLISFSSPLVQEKENLFSFNLNFSTYYFNAAASAPSQPKEMEPMILPDRP